MNSIKKITCIINNISSTGGAERVMTVLCNEFVEEGIDTTIIVRQDSKCSYPLDPRVKVISTAVDNINNKFRRNIKRNLILRKKIKETNPDVIISFMTGMNIQVLFYTIGLKYPIIISERNDPEHDISIRDKLGIKLLYRRATGYVFQTDDAKKWFGKKISSKSIIIPNPISDSLPTRKEKIPGKIVCVGRLTHQKNHVLAINAFEVISKKFDSAKMHFYGDGPEETSLKQYVKQKSLDGKIIFEGYASDVMEKISDAEMFLLTSDYEGMPNALMEAMGMGIPVISTDCPCGGPRYLITNGANGILVPVRDTKALSDAMEFYFENSKIAQTYGEKAESICERLNSKKIANKWIKYCEKMIRKEE